MLSVQSRSAMICTYQIDLVEEVIERQLRKYRTKISAKKYAPAIFQDDFVEADDAEDEEIKIVRTKEIWYETYVS